MLKGVLVVMAMLQVCAGPSNRAVANSASDPESEPEDKASHHRMGALLDGVLLRLRNGETLGESERQQWFESFGQYADALRRKHKGKYNYSYPEPDRTDFYLNAVKMAFIDWPRHGGWPFRSTLRDYVVPEVNRRFKDSCDPFLIFSVFFVHLNNGRFHEAADSLHYLHEWDLFLMHTALKWLYAVDSNANALISWCWQCGESAYAERIALACRYLGLKPNVEAERKLHAEIEKWALTRLEQTEGLNPTVMATRDKEALPEAYTKLAYIYTQQGKREEAEALLNRLLDFLDMDPNDKEYLYRVAATHHTLARMRLEEDRPEEAEATYRRLLEKVGSDRLLESGGTTRKVLERLADLVRERGQYEEAESLYRMLLDHAKATWGADNTHVRRLLGCLGICYRHQKAYARAELMFKGQLAILGRMRVPYRSGKARILRELAWLCHDQRKYGEAEAYARQALSLLELHYPEDHDVFPPLLEDLAILCRDAGSTADADSFAARAEAVQRGLRRRE